MKRTYPSGYHKKQEKKRRNEEARKCSASLTMWLKEKPAISISDGIMEADDTISDSGRKENFDINQNKNPEQSNARVLFQDQIQPVIQSEQANIVVEKEIGGEKETQLDQCYDVKEITSQKETYGFPKPITDTETKKRIIAAGPCQPPGPFPRNKHTERSFSSNYYSFVTRSGIKLNRSWLSYSTTLDCVYCQACWLFPQKRATDSRSPWETGLSDWGHLTERIKSHETSQSHTSSCLVYEQWRNNATVDEVLIKQLKDERNFWRSVLKRIIDVSLLLAICNLPFRGKSSNMADPNKGNFLSIIELLAEYDPILKELLLKPNGSVNYLSPTIQNEVISLLAGKVLDQIVSEVREAPFFSIILDTTQDISKTDQLSEVFRYVKVINDENGKPCEIKILESFTSFTAVKDPTAAGLSELIIKSMAEKGLDAKKCRGQGFDGAAVMSGAYNGVQKRIKEIAPHAYFVHCASHNLNLVLKDAVEANREIGQFFETVQNVYNFFGLSIVRWDNLKEYSESRSNVTLKTLNPTRWAGRYDAVYALKERFTDVLKALAFIILKSKNSKEKNEAIGLKKKLESFGFVLLLIIQSRILENVNLVSKSLQEESIDINSAYDLLGNALREISSLRESFDLFVDEATEICNKWGIPSQFSLKRVIKVKSYFDELCEDQRLSDPKSRFKVTAFYPMIDTICSQLDSRFMGMKALVNAYKVIQPCFLVSATDKELSEEADKFGKTFSQDVSPFFKSQLLAVRSSFRSKIKSLENVQQLAHLLIIEHSSLATSYPDVCTACYMYMTVPVTVAKAERTFSKLKLIKNFLRSTMNQERLSGLALLSIENDKARKLDVEKIIDNFADLKSRKKIFTS